MGNNNNTTEKTDIVILCDSNRDNFAEWACGILPNIDRDQHLELRHGGSFNITENDGQLIIDSPHIPYDLNICMPATFEHDMHETYKGARFVLVEEFPFGTEDYEEHIKKLIKNDCEVLVVFVDSKRRPASSDMDNPDDAIMTAKEDYENLNCCVSIVKDRSQFFHALHWRMPVLKMFENRAINQLNLI